MRFSYFQKIYQNANSRRETLERYKDILEKDKKGNSIPCLTKKASTGALAITVSECIEREQRLPVFGLAYLSENYTRLSFLEHVIGNAVLFGLANVWWFLSSALSGKTPRFDKNFSYLNLFCFCSIIILELYTNLSVKRNFCKYLEISGDLVEKYTALKIRPFMNELTRDLLKSDGFDV